MSQYINEAFKQFRLLESEDFDLSPNGLDTLDTFMNQAMSDEDIDVIDLEAEAEEDLKKSYIGKVICDCNVCHSNIFYNKEDIEINEDGIVNIEDECPYCMSLDGYTIVGEIKPYEEGVAEEEHEDDVDLDVDLEGNEEAEEPIEIESEEDDDLDESLTEAFSEGQRVYIKPNKRFGKIKSHIKNDLYEVETYDGEDKNLPDRVDTYYASDLELKESLPLSGAKLKESLAEDVDSGRMDDYHWLVDVEGLTPGEAWEQINTFDYADDEDLHESIELGDDGQTIWSGVPVREDSIANNAHKTNRMIWSDDDEEGYIEYLVSLGIPDEQLCHEFYTRGWNSEDALEEYKKSDLSLHESIENVSIDTDDETMTMTTKEDGGIVIETSPKEEFEETFGEEEPTELETSDEMIAPLEPETEDELGISDEPEEDTDFDFGEEPPEEDVDIDEFDEETFDGLGESYLRRCYENVKSFKTTGVTCNENLLTVEGNIGFKSGNVKKTSFIFEAKESNNGKYVFEGYNNEINIGNKAFRLNCSIDNKKIIPESLSYNYRSKNELNESVKLHGTVKAPKRG